MPMVRTIKAGKTPEEWEQQPAKNAQKDKDESFRPAPTPVHPGSHAQLPETKGGVCVSTVSIVCGRGGGLPDRARADQRLRADMNP